MKVPGVVAAAAHTLEVGQGKAASSDDAPPPPVGLRRLWLLVLVQLFPFALGVVALPALLLDACGGSEHEAATYVTLGNSLFFGLQWACAGAWGGFSDRAGRRPLLLVGVASDALGAALLATVPLGALPRVYVALAACRGIFSQSRIALFAAIADVSESSALARNYGAFGVAFGLCFEGGGVARRIEEVEHAAARRGSIHRARGCERPSRAQGLRAVVVEPACDWSKAAHSKCIHTSNGLARSVARAAVCYRLEQWCDCRVLDRGSRRHFAGE